MKLNLDDTQLQALRPPRHYNNLEVTNLDPMGKGLNTFPREIEVKQGNVEGSRLLALWYGEIGLSLGDKVRARFDGTDTEILIVEGMGSNNSVLLNAGLKFTGIKTGAYTGNNGELVQVDTTSGQVEITLPANPLINHRMGVIKVSDDFNFLKVNGNGNNVVGVWPVRRVEASTSLLNYHSVAIWQYDGGGTWQCVSVSNIGQYFERWAATPITGVPVSPGVTIQWTFNPAYTGQISQFFSYAAGVFTCILPAWLTFNFYTQEEFTANANNVDLDSKYADVFTGTGTIVMPDILSSKSSSRTGTFPASNTSGGAIQTNLNDTLQFTAEVTQVTGNMTVDLTAAVLVFSI